MAFSLSLSLSRSRSRFEFELTIPRLHFFEFDFEHGQSSDQCIEMRSQSHREFFAAPSTSSLNERTIRSLDSDDENVLHSSSSLGFANLSNLFDSTRIEFVPSSSFASSAKTRSAHSNSLSRSDVHFREKHCRSHSTKMSPLQKRGNASQPKGFFGSLVENIKEELNKNKDIKVKSNERTNDQRTFSLSLFVS